MDESLHIGFIGLGLIGGSIAKSFKKFKPGIKISAYDKTDANLQKALQEGVIDQACIRQDPAFSQCDYIFLCAPVSENISCLPWLKEMMAPSCVLTDVGSVKGEIHKHIHALGMENCFIGGHPMAGSEKSGYENATDYLIENAYYLLTPGEEIDIMKLSSMMELITGIGAIPLVLTFEEHDYVTAAISHLPHIIASTLVNTIQQLDTPEETMKLIAAGGFKDLTRIASSSPVMWQQICKENRTMISKVLDEYIKMIVQAKCWVDNSDTPAINAMFTNSKDYRDSFPESSTGALDKIYALYCDLYDETGEIAKVASILARQEINMKNIGIVHNREFEDGVLRIEFYNDESCKKAAQVLKVNQYTIYKR